MEDIIMETYSYLLTPRTNIKQGLKNFVPKQSHGRGGRVDMIQSIIGFISLIATAANTSAALVLDIAFSSQLVLLFCALVTLYIGVRLFVLRSINEIQNC